MQHRKHRNVRLASASGCAEKHVLVGFEGARKDTRLHAVERAHALEGGVRPLGELLDGHEALVVGEGLRLERGHVHLLVPLLLHAVRSRGQLALLVRHQVATRRKRKRLEVKDVTAYARLAGLGHSAQHVLRNDACRILGGSHAREVGGLFAHTRLELLRFSEDLVRLHARRLQQLEHLRLLRVLSHAREERGSLGLALRLREPSAHRHLPPVLEQQLDHVELVVVQQDD
mmetsp:Transcript_35800/g.83559  ORF Transcript_35800/g.83559 Transcript_35800/m.83559 type:complete len:230 (-) Transcript_35800:1019-1708(-)